MPSIDGLNRILLESFQIQKQKRLWRPARGGGLVPYWLLSVFWNHRVGIIIKVDEYTGTAVTVITPNEAQGARRWHGLKQR
ncbi:MAG: hypothetical protein ABFD98_15755 [Syntrophobacteraceae bacterium]|nr:hypothetical protein [Desulfobacteraceae bacterium]